MEKQGWRTWGEVSVSDVGGGIRTEDEAFEVTDDFEGVFG